jgi:hypothetical protein
MQVSDGKTGSKDRHNPQPSNRQLTWLRRGLDQPGGKLPLFDRHGQKVSAQTVRSCIDNGWAEPWFSNPIKPDWLVCKLTDGGRAVAERNASRRRLQA